MNWRRSLGLVAGGPQRRLLGLQIAGHAVEGARQDGDLLRVAVGRRPARVEVAAGHPARRLHQPRRPAPEMALAAAMPSQTAPTSTSSAVST